MDASLVVNLSCGQELRYEVSMSDLDFDDFVFNKLISDKERDHIKLMVSDYSALLDGLNDDNPHFRLAATEILKSHWNLPVEQQRSVFGRLFDDSFELVRCMAYDYWGSTFRCTKDKAACSHLAKIALDKTKSNRERRTAHSAVEQILGTSVFLRPLEDRQDEQLSQMLVEKKIDEATNDLLPEMDIELLKSLAVNHHH